jgi:hypothetical protein
MQKIKKDGAVLETFLNSNLLLNKVSKITPPAQQHAETYTTSWFITPKKRCISQLYMKKKQRWSAIQIGIERNLTSHFKIVRIQT